MKKIISLLFAAVMALTISAQKQNVSVLYVGGSADMETMGVGKIDSLKLKKMKTQRFNSFKSFLQSKFKKVKCIDASQYDYTMSDAWDVTVFDGRIKNSLPMNFSRPVLCIANASEDIGRSVGTKNDWLCLCLQNKAHDWKADHDIFKGPFKVTIKTKKEKVPENYFEYQRIYKVECPEQLDMWEVHTYPNNDVRSGYRIGMVSRPGGYLDSPETEVISSGVCAKGRNSVAIGRHANYLHWGFSASPKYLTESGKAAFANAIVYISKFNGQHPIARKLNENIPTRDEMVARADYLTTQECVDEMNELDRQFYQMTDSIYKSAMAKTARGEELDGNEELYMKYPPRPYVPMSLTDFIKQQYSNLYKYFGTDHDMYVQFYEKNKGFLYQSGYDVDVDVECRELGIVNNDIRMLDKCISILESKKGDVKAAENLLKRYTLCRFETPQQWRSWYETYKDKMFFTESGGWLWLINDLGDVPGNDYNVLIAEQEEAKKNAVKAQQKPQPQPTAKVEADAPLKVSDDSPVAHAVKIEKNADGTKTLVIRQQIHTGWHTYVKNAANDTFIETEVSIDTPATAMKVGEMKIPEIHKSATGTTIYTGYGEFRQQFSADSKGKLTVKVYYQCCNDNACLIPQEHKMEVEL
ncbi:MAG: protein-disulfide reductase DsbD N-terminal domain-containing protein [Prevotella sp.]|nr:protein-disulfide reductase DsbD N-terminal domain-containing protein [Prevotella sp.]